MAIVDLINGEIYGCKKGSRVWWHEKGHLVFNQLETGVKVNYWNGMFQMVSLFSLSLGVLTDSLFFKTFGFVNALAMIVCYLYEEAWCWGYSFKNYS